MNSAPIQHAQQVHISRREWVWALIAGVLIMALTTLPSLAGRLAQTPQWVFGGAVYDRMDYNHHLAGMHIGKRGEWRLQLLNSSEPQTGGYVKLFYIPLGHLVRILNLPIEVAFEGARLVCGLIVLLAMYAFAAACLLPVALRRTAFLFFGLGSGLGWLLLLIGWLPQADLSPIDFWLIDAYGFFTLLTFPHIAAVIALLLFAVLAFFRWQAGGGIHWLLLAGICLVLVLAIQPFAPLVVDVALAGYVALGWIKQRRLVWREGWGLGVLALLQLPIFLYNVWFFQSDDIWRSFQAQNVTLSPPVVYYLFGYGVLLPLAVWGGWRLLLRRQSNADLALTWIVGVAVLVYSPLLIQRRFTEGVMAPLAVLATIGLGYGLLPWFLRLAFVRRGLAWLRYPRRRARGLLLALFVAATVPSSLYLTLGGALFAASRPETIFDRGEVVQAVDWLGANANWDMTVFAAQPTGSLIPAHIGQRVYLGHPIETAFYQEKKTDVADFYSDNLTDDERLMLLQACGCRYVFHGPAERTLGEYDPTSADFLVIRYTSSMVTIYEFVP